MTVVVLWKRGGAAAKAATFLVNLANQTVPLCDQHLQASSCGITFSDGVRSRGYATAAHQMTQKQKQKRLVKKALYSRRRCERDARMKEVAVAPAVRRAPLAERLSAAVLITKAHRFWWEVIGTIVSFRINSYCNLK